MLRSIRKQPRKIVQSVPKKKRRATVGRICRKGTFLAWNERVRGDGILDDSASGRKPLGMGREAIILSHYSKVMLLLTLKWPPIKPLYLKSAARR